MQKNFAIFLCLFLVIIFIQSCVIPQNSDDNLVSTKQMNEPLSKKEKITNLSNGEGLSHKQVFDLFKKITSKSYIFQKEDILITDKIPYGVEENSILEALLVIAIMQKIIYEPITQKNNLQEQDLPASGPAQTNQEANSVQDQEHQQRMKNPLSLSSIYEERGINFLRALEENPFLSDYAAAFLALKASEQTTNTIVFDGRIKEIFNNREAAQTAVSAPKAAELEISQETQTEQVPSQMTSKNSVSATKPNNLEESSKENQLENALQKETTDIESLFLKAEEMIDDEKFKEAIEFLNQIPKDHPLFQKAEQKIKEIANLAVQKLRQKAAKSFQAANPVHDQKARKAYLLEAKKYLEEALETYQGSEKLSVVKQNLDVINRQLESLSDGIK